MVNKASSPASTPPSSILSDVLKGQSIAHSGCSLRSPLRRRHEALVPSPFIDDPCFQGKVGDGVLDDGGPLIRDARCEIRIDGDGDGDGSGWRVFVHAVRIA